MKTLIMMLVVMMLSSTCFAIEPDACKAISSFGEKVKAAQIAGVEKSEVYEAIAPGRDEMNHAVYMAMIAVIRAAYADEYSSAESFRMTVYNYCMEAGL